MTQSRPKPTPEQPSKRSPGRGADPGSSSAESTGCGPLSSSFVLGRALSESPLFDTCVLDAQGRVIGPGTARPWPDGSGRVLSPGLHVADLLPSGSRESFLELFRQALAGVPGASASLQTGERGGRIRVAEFWLLPVPGPDMENGAGGPGEPAVALLARDITDFHEETEKLRRGTLEVIRLNAEMRTISASREMALRNLEELSGRLKGVLEAASRVAIVATSPSGVITMFNPGAANLLGYAPNEVEGLETPLSFLDEDEVAARGRALGGNQGRGHAGMAALMALARSGRRDFGEWTLVRKDGTRFAAELALSAIEGPHGVEGYLLVGVDVSGRKAAEAAMAEREARLRAILDGATDGILTVDTDGRIESLNPAALAMFGFLAEELEGQPLKLVAPKISPAFLAKQAGMVRETIGLRPGGERFPMELAVSAVELSTRTLFTCIVRDITSRREAEEVRRRYTRRLAEQQAALERDLKAAAEIQKSLLPRNLPPDPRFEARWLFDPSAAIGGDIFNILDLGGGLMAAYILDVSGHGAPSALVAAAAAQALQLHSRGGSGGDSGGPAPERVLTALDLEFPLERFDRYFSMAYLTLDLDRGLMRYCNAGHPPPLLVRAGGAVEELRSGGTVIGLGGLLPFEPDSRELAPGDVLVLYTDGLTEFEDASGVPYGLPRLEKLLSGAAGRGAGFVLEVLNRDIEGFCGGLRPQDDLSVLVLSYKTPGKDDGVNS